MPHPSPDHDAAPGCWPWRATAVRSVAALTFTAMIAALSFASLPGSGLHLVGTSVLFNIIGVTLILEGASWRAAVAQAPTTALCAVAFVLLAGHLHYENDPLQPPLIGTFLVACAAWVVPYLLCSTAARRYLERRRS